MMDPEDAALVRWAKRQGIRFEGLAIKKQPGRGRGIVASRRIEKNEHLVAVPPCALISPDKSPSLRKALPKISNQGLLAAALCHPSKVTQWREWRATLPSPEEMRGLPYYWPRALVELCGHELEKIVTNQRTRIAADCALALPVLGPSVTVERYTHAWFLANTRVFYWNETGRSMPSDECVAMCPLLDLFNHYDGGLVADKGSDPRVLEMRRTKGEYPNYVTQGGYNVIADRVYEVGEEILLCYGNHSNLFLLGEYGFIPHLTPKSRSTIIMGPPISFEPQNPERAAWLSANYSDGETFVVDQFGPDTATEWKLLANTASDAQWNLATTSYDPLVQSCEMAVNRGIMHLGSAFERQMEQKFAWLDGDEALAIGGQWSGALQIIRSVLSSQREQMHGIKVEARRCFRMLQARD